MPNSDTQTSPAKNPAPPVIFRLLLFLVPIILICFLEIALRLFWVTETTALFIDDKFNPEYVSVNQIAGKRYFQGSGFGLFGTQDVMRKLKTDRTLRIFVLGGSSTAGYPYMYSGTFSAFLKTRLESAYPDYEIEVINLGMTAITSYAVRDFVRECLIYNPDLFIIYAGHNEFYGALGSGSSQNSLFGTNRTLTLAYLRLRQFKLFQLIQYLLQFARSPDQEKPEDSRTLMARMAKKQEIATNSTLYSKTLAIYQQNFEDILRWTDESHVPVLFGTLVSNLRDRKPFVSLRDPKVDQEAFDNHIQEIKKLMINEDYNLALKQLQFLIKLDPNYALVYFYTGRCQELLGDFEMARVFYGKARDLDGLRFRAPSDFNKMIHHQVDLWPQAYVTDLVMTFTEASPNNLIGQSLILEHLHPNLEGYFLMGKAFVETILENDLLSFAAGRNLPKLPPLPSEDYFNNRIAVTPLDHQIAKYRIQLLTSGWPFENHHRFNTIKDLHAETLIEKLAVDVLSKKSDYEKAHVYLAETYLKNGQFSEAVDEYYALATTFPINESPWLAMGKILVKQQEFDRALPVLEKTLTLVDDLFSIKWAGTIYLTQNNPEKALPLLEQAYIVNPNDGQNLYNLSGAYFMKGDTAEALASIEKLLALYPEFPKARSFHEQLRKVYVLPQNE